MRESRLLIVVALGILTACGGPEKAPLTPDDHVQEPTDTTAPQPSALGVDDKSTPPAAAAPSEDKTVTATPAAPATPATPAAPAAPAKKAAPKPAAKKK
jgi:hypothetical protein